MKKYELKSEYFSYGVVGTPTNVKGTYVGDIVILKDGGYNIGLVIENEPGHFSVMGYCMDGLTNHMTIISTQMKYQDVIKNWDSIKKSGLVYTNSINMFEVEDVKEMSVAEISKQLGYTVKVVE